MHLILQVQIPDDNRPFPTKAVWQADLYDASRHSAEAYALRVGAEYRCLTQDVISGGYHASYQRLSMLEMTEPDKILYVDSDCVIAADCPDIFTMEVEGLAAVPDFDVFNYRHHGLLRRNIRRMLEFTDEGHETFCAGVLLTTREWRERVAPIVRANFPEWYAKRFRDQEMLNKAHGETPYTRLSPDWGAWYKEGEFINHFSGPRRKEFKSD